MSSYSKPLLTFSCDVISPEQSADLIEAMVIERQEETPSGTLIQGAHPTLGAVAVVQTGNAAVLVTT
jgi:hypothetical protein